MAGVKLLNIEGAQDSDKRAMIEGEQVGTVYRGWLRTGGEQWVFTGEGSQFGGATLAEIKREISRRFISN